MTSPAFVAACLAIVFSAQVGVGQAPSAVHTRRGSNQALPLSKFYDTPSPLPAGKPGELIRSEAADEYLLSADYSALRILYYSRSAAGQDAAVSAVVLVPTGSPPKGGWPVIAWAHGFTGAGRQCAPSLQKNLDSGPFLSMYIGLGYAVVATDYAGLGTDARQAVFDMTANASDVAYSIPAARKAVPQLGSKWVAMGSGWGADVVIGTAELQTQLHDPGYLGGIAIAGASDLRNMYERLPKEVTPGMMELLAYAVKSAFPEFNLSSMLNENGRQSYQRIQESCSSVGTSMGLSGGDFLKPDWKSDKLVNEFFDRNSPGRRSASGPLLLISDDASPAIPASETAQVAARLCKQGVRVQLNKFDDTQPGMVLGDSVGDQKAWIEARFAGKNAPSNCK